MSKGNATGIKLKVFICYARGKARVLDRFVDGFVKSFEEYSKTYGFELLMDLKPHAGNMHARFRNFARTCHIALLLVNSRFIQEDSYASQHEIPILKRRKKESKVIVVGIRLTDVGSALAKWNQKGDFYFAPIRNIDLPFTRRKEAGNEQYLNDFAIYQTIEPGDEETYHRILQEQIIELLNVYTDLQPDPLEEEPETDFQYEKTRSNIITEEILALMSDNLLLKQLEDNLSRDVYLWRAARLNLPEDKESYTWSYCLWHSRWYQDFRADIKKMSLHLLHEERHRLESQLEEKNRLLLRLIEGIEVPSFLEQINTSEDLFAGLSIALLHTQSWKYELTNFQTRLCDRLLRISEVLDDWSDKAFQLVEIDLV